MSLICLSLRMELLSDAIFSSGNSTPGGEDIALRMDGKGVPVVPGSTVKGLLRESMTNYLCWTRCKDKDDILPELFGEEGWNGGENAPDFINGEPPAVTNRARRAVFGDLRPEDETADWMSSRAFTALEDQVIKTGSLRVAVCLREGLVFRGELLCDQTDAKHIQNACKALKWAGLLRHRGFGRIRVTAERSTQLRHVPPVAETALIRYRLKLLTPMTIPQYSRSAGGWDRLNDTNTKKYVPGSAVRGLIISTIAREKPDWFQAHKAELLGKSVRFLNAYPVVGEQTAIPTPMGFYEDKGNTRFYSVLTREVIAEDKRADIGPFSVIDGALHLNGYSPKITVSLRMKRGDTREDKQVFTTNSIAAGTVFEGYIQLDNPTLAPEISSAFYDKAWLGADKYAGNGLCQVSDVGPAEQSYGRQYSYSETDPVPTQLYMMLLSPTSMTEKGEVIGISEERLADLLEIPRPDDDKVKRVKINRCSASVTERVGYNSTWGCATPVDVMYEAGSVFCLTCSTAPSVKAIRRLEETGIGLNRSEGCGQVLFLRDYERYGKAPKSKSEFQPGKEVRFRQARCRWLLENRIPAGLSKSQLGSIQVLCEQAIAQEGDHSQLDTFFSHNLNDRGDRHRARFEGFKERFDQLMNTPLAETLKVESCPDGPVERLKLICDWINLSRKEVEG